MVQSGRSSDDRRRRERGQREPGERDRRQRELRDRQRRAGLLSALAGSVGAASSAPATAPTSPSEHRRRAVVHRVRSPTARCPTLPAAPPARRGGRRRRWSASTPGCLGAGRRRPACPPCRGRGARVRGRGQVDAEVRHHRRHLTLHRVGQRARHREPAEARRSSRPARRRGSASAACDRGARTARRPRRAGRRRRSWRLRRRRRPSSAASAALGAGASTVAYADVRRSSSCVSFMPAPPRSVGGGSRARGAATTSPRRRACRGCRPPVRARGRR